MHYPLWFPYSLPKLLEAIHLLKAQIPQTERGISSQTRLWGHPLYSKIPYMCCHYLLSLLSLSILKNSNHASVPPLS